MQHLPPEAIREYLAIAKDAGQDLTYEEAEIEAQDFLKMYALSQGVLNII